MSLLAFILTIFILVTFHEFGHYLFARLFKVKVLEFAIGFGPKICHFTTKSNKWSIGIIPLGGYVKMLDEREGEVVPELKHLAFNNKKPWQKILIAFAGPFFNLLFAFLAFYSLALYGVQELKPYIASINPTIQTVSSLAELDKTTIKEINQIKVSSWNDANKVLSNELIKNSNISFIYSESDGSTHNLKLNLAQLYNNYDQHLSLENLGLSPILYDPVISYIQPDSSASKYGLKVGDKIISINNVKYTNWFELTETIHDSVDKPVVLTIERESQLLNIKIIPDTVSNSGQLNARLGIMPSVNQNALANSTYIKQYSAFNAIEYAYDSTVRIIYLNYTSIKNLIVGDMSLKELGGPITIAKAGNGALSSSLKDYVVFLAIISIGLAFMNLLPIPVLDGGHILIYTIELLINKELSHNIQLQIFKLGFIFVIGISLFAIYNDLLRL